MNLFRAYHLACDEDNLTRAFIQTIRLISAKARELFLRDLLARAKHRMLTGGERKLHPEEREYLGRCVFSGAAVALQDNIPEEHDPRYKDDYSFARVVTISRGDPPQELAGERPKYSRPDAWIFGGGEFSYCLLVECKYQKKNPIERHQICRHWNNWLRGKNEVKGWDDIAPGLLDLTWYDVLEVIKKLVPMTVAAGGGFARANPSLAEQDETVLNDLREFLGFSPYGYRLFKGFDFGDVPESLHTDPGWQLCLYSGSKKAIK